MVSCSALIQPTLFVIVYCGFFPRFSLETSCLLLMSLNPLCPDLPREKSSVLKYQEILLTAKVDKSKSYRELPSYYMAFSLFFPFSLIFYLNKDFAGQVTVICLHAAG